MSLGPTELFYMAIGLLSVAAIYYFNRHLYGARAKGLGVSFLEITYYVTALAAIIIGWYFNMQYMRDYPDAGWANWTGLLFVNPASASGGQDLIFANIVILPLWTIVDGRRSGLKMNWLYFPMSLLTSYAFAIALFLAMKERQLKYNRVA